MDATEAVPAKTPERVAEVWCWNWQRCGCVFTGPGLRGDGKGERCLECQAEAERKERAA